MLSSDDESTACAHQPALGSVLRYNNEYLMAWKKAPCVFCRSLFGDSYDEY